MFGSVWLLYLYFLPLYPFKNSFLGIYEIVLSVAMFFYFPGEGWLNIHLLPHSLNSTHSELHWFPLRLTMTQINGIYSISCLDFSSHTIDSNISFSMNCFLLNKNQKTAVKCLLDDFKFTSKVHNVKENQLVKLDWSE